MNASWGVWVLSAVSFLVAIQFFKALPSASDFRRLAGGLGILALVAAAAREDLRWHLLWFTPIALAAAYVYAFRRMFALMHRVKKIAKSGMSDPEQIRRALQDEVEEYNRDAPDDAKMR